MWARSVMICLYLFSPFLAKWRFHVISHPADSWNGRFSGWINWVLFPAEHVASRQTSLFCGGKKTFQIRQRLPSRWLLRLFLRKKNNCPKSFVSPKSLSCCSKTPCPCHSPYNRSEVSLGLVIRHTVAPHTKASFFILKPNVFGTIVQSSDFEPMPNPTTPVDESKAPLCLEIHCILYFLSFFKAKNEAFFPLCRAAPSCDSAHRCLIVLIHRGYRTHLFLRNSGAFSAPQ